MAVYLPPRTVNYQKRDYGLKVLDPVDGKEVFNAKYPIFGSDITNAAPQIITRRVTVTNSSGAFNEPATPSIPWVNDGNWRSMAYNQMNSRLLATIPHGQKRKPQFMTTGFANIRHTMRMRYWHQDQNGSMTYNSVYNSVTTMIQSIPPRLGGPGSWLPYPTSFASYQFNNVGPYTSPIYGSVGAQNIAITADDTNIYIHGTISQTLNYQRLRGSFGWDRYEKYWSDFSGSWYEFTFYILPYNKTQDIFIR